MSHKYRMVEGGQLFMHRLRMFKQTMKVVLVFSSVAIFILLSALIFWSFDWYDCYIAIMYLWAYTKLSLQIIMPKSYWFIDFYLRDMTLVRADCKSFMNDSYVRGTAFRLLETIKSVIYYSPILIVVSTIGSMQFFGAFSKKQRASLSSKELLRGKELATPEELAGILYKQGKASDLKLDDLPLVKDKETSHVLITGTTGSGKTNCFHTLLPQIRKRGNSAIVIDMTGDLVSRYYREGYDIILNPLDKRTMNWNIWDECESPEELESFAEAFIPQKGRGHDPFWENASRKLLIAAIEKCRDEQDLNNLLKILVSSKLSDYSNFFSNTDAATFAEKEGGKTTLSIRSTLASQITCFKYFHSEGQTNFSIRQWIKKAPKNEWLFITATPSQRQLLRPLMSAWLNTTINSIMSLIPEEQRRVWLIIDELPSLNNIPSIKTGLAEFRKYGGCVMAGIQSFPQLVETYGESNSQSMLDLFNTKIMFRTTDPTACQWVSKVIGETEYAESQENLSFGANSVRDGVSLGKAERIKQVVMASEVSNLNDLECYIKYPGDYPSTRMKMIYKVIPK